MTKNTIGLSFLAVAVMAAAASAGTWPAGYTWTSGEEGGQMWIGAYYGGNETTAWGLGWEYSNPDPVNIPPDLIQHCEWDADRGGQAGKAQKDVLVSGAKSKYRSDGNTYPSRLAAGPGMVYSGNPVGLSVGFKVNSFDSSGSTREPLRFYTRNNRAGVRLAASETTSTILGVTTNFKPDNSAANHVAEITGDWTLGTGEWTSIKLVIGQENYPGQSYARWDAWISDANLNEIGHMAGWSTGDSGTYVQFGWLDGNADNASVTYDGAAFGTGADNIGGFVPEPASLVLMLVGGMGLIRRRRA